MSVSGFFSSVADKAQNALSNTPLSQHLPSRTGATRPSTGAPPPPSDSGGAHKSHALEQIQHQFRQIQQTYSSAGPLQKIVTSEKGIALDFKALSRDVQAHSKELYMWGQNESSDVKDVSDRLAFLNFIAGSLASTLSAKLDSARTPLKQLRDNEAALTQKRNVRAGLDIQISRVEHGQEKGYEKRVAELREQLAKAERDDEPAEQQHEILLRKALKESEQLRFQALREYGEKLSLVAQAADAVLAVLPSVPPSSSRPYPSAEETGAIRASLQHALDDWKPGQVTLSAPPGANLDRSNTRSFGETHAAELERINTVEHHVESSRRDPSPVPLPVPAPIQELGSGSSPTLYSQTQRASFSSPLVEGSASGINPTGLNNEPAPIPSRSPAVGVTLPGPADTEATVPSVTPTVAETGVPVSGGSDGPGPLSGSLRDIRSSESSSSYVVSNIVRTPTQEEGRSNRPPKRYESAEEEKRRLEREERERLLHGDTPPAGPSAPTYETGDEKKGGANPEDGGDTPPPYQDI